MKLLVTGAFAASQGNLAALRAAGHDVLSVEDERGALPELASEAEGIVCNSLLHHHDLARFPRLRVVQLTSVGLDRVPVAELERRGIEVFNARGVYSVPMAEWVVMQILLLTKRARFFMRNQEERRWEKARDLTELAGRTACIVGFGEVGKEVAKRLRAFDMRVAAVTAHPSPSQFADSVLGAECLGEAVAHADVVVLAVPLTAETHHLIDARVIRLM